MSHIMLHSDQLAQEFAEILNAVEIFEPLLPLDPAVTFYAPLRNNVTDLRGNQDDFSRASDAWYRDGSGIYRNVGINQARFEQSRLLMEPAQTNKCTNYNARPDSALTNLSLSGDASAIMRRVNDASALEAAGLGHIGNGFAIELDNSAGSVDANCTVIGTFQNTNINTISAYCRKISGIAECDIRTSGGQMLKEFDNVDYKRIVSTGTPGGAGQNLRLTCSGGVIARWVLQQSEESPVVTSPIVTEGTAGQRAIDVLQYADLDNWFPQAEGMTVVTWSPHYSSAELTSGIERMAGIVSTRLNVTSLLRVIIRTNLVTQFQSIDSGFNNPTVETGGLISGDDYTVAVRWNTAQNELQVGFSPNGGAWVWSPVRDYSGLFTSQNFLAIGALIDLPAFTKDVFIYNEDRGIAWIEANH